MTVQPLGTRLAVDTQDCQTCRGKLGIEGANTAKMFGVIAIQSAGAVKISVELENKMRAIYYTISLGRTVRIAKPIPSAQFMSHIAHKTIKGETILPIYFWPLAEMIIYLER